MPSEPLSLEKLVYLPRPRRISAGDGVLPVSGWSWSWSGYAAAWRVVAARIEGFSAAGVPVTVLSRIDRNHEAYTLALEPDGVTVEANSAEGVFRAGSTLSQIIRQCPAGLPCGTIVDSPDLPVRGVMVDISRDKVPSMATLFRIVDELSAWKINHVELYTEHTFAYANHREVWEFASPMTHEQVRELDRYCRERFIELVPNQNTFGHMHRWLKHPRYRELAECPDGYTTPWSEKRSDPFSLNPLDPRSLALVDELLSELLPCFTSHNVNVGCDETFDLGQGKSRAECERLGKGRVYLDYLLKVHALTQRSGHTMHFWGDIILHHPELIPELPRDLVALVWGYEAEHPFATQCEAFAKSGIAFHVCPGTSAWCTIAGRTQNMMENIRSAVRNGLAHGASGFLNTDWGDNGHWQPLPVSYPGYAWGAALSWCFGANESASLESMLDVHVFKDEAAVMGQLVLGLGNAYLKTGHLIANASALFRILNLDQPARILASVPDEALVATSRYILDVIRPVEKARMKRDDAELIMNEMATVSEMLIHACARGILLRKGQEQGNGPLASDMGEILNDYRRNWLARNRPGGLGDSSSVVERRLAHYAHIPA